MLGIYSSNNGSRSSLKEYIVEPEEAEELRYE